MYEEMAVGTISSKPSWVERRVMGRLPWSAMLLPRLRAVLPHPVLRLACH